MPSSELAGIIIKAQHNVRSDAKSYGKMAMPAIFHEYLLVWRKSRRVMSALSTLGVIANEQARRLRSTWRAVVRAVLAKVGGKADLATLYDEMAKRAPEKVASNAHWKEKVRQTLQLGDEFVSLERGVWALRA